MNAKFNLKDARAEKTKLMLIIREGHDKKIKIYTDMEVSPKDWDNTAQNFKRTHPYFKLDSERLLKWKTSAAEAIRESDIAGEELEDVKLRILSKFDKETTTERSDEKSKFLPYYERWITTETTKRTVTRQMRYSLNLFREFVGDSDPCFDNITIKFIENFIEWMAKKGLKANTRGSHIKRIKTAMSEAFDAGLHNSREFEKFRVEKEQVENIYLSEEEIRKIEELPLSGRKERSRDLFIIGCHTAMRFSQSIPTAWKDDTIGYTHDNYNYLDVSNGENYKDRPRNSNSSSLNADSEIASDENLTPIPPKDKYTSMEEFALMPGAFSVSAVSLH